MREVPRMARLRVLRPRLRSMPERTMPNTPPKMAIMPHALSTTPMCVGTTNSIRATAAANPDGPGPWPRCTNAELRPYWARNVRARLCWDRLSTAPQGSVARAARQTAPDQPVPTAAQNTKSRKGRMVLDPTQLATNGQWWSIPLTQCPHELQWCASGGLKKRHLLQYR